MLQLLSSIVLICLSSFKLCLCVISLEWQAYFGGKISSLLLQSGDKGFNFFKKVSQPGTAAAAIHRVVYLDPAQLIYFIRGCAVAKGVIGGAWVESIRVWVRMRICLARPYIQT